MLRRLNLKMLLSLVSILVLAVGISIGAAQVLPNEGATDPMMTEDPALAPPAPTDPNLAVEPVPAPQGGDAPTGGSPLGA